ncbi:MAG: glycoside hydrolase family 16 protein [Bacteroidales bacterium]|nr:glycoside hydrolase family 16 protein [Bacteroidales bacterium]
MKARLILILSLAVSLLVLVSCGPGEQRPTWAEEFNGDSFDTTVWAKIPRGPSPWDWHMASNDELFEVKDGCLTLRAIVNPDTTVDKAPLLTGGLITRMPLCFGYGKLEIRAKLEGTGGGWPAIWMMPVDDGEDSSSDPYWDPYDYRCYGEIDICERLNFEPQAYQTLHTTYNLKPDDDSGQPKSATGAIVPDDFNIYTMEHYRDSICLSINGVSTITYRKLTHNPEGKELPTRAQWTFDRNFDLRIDMQVGAPWPGDAVLEDLPAEMTVDWVRFYAFKDE